MKEMFIYPGSFCPPTYGHLWILKKASQIFPFVTVVCSVNPDKTEKMFTPEESKQLWQSYKLPENCEIMTLDEFFKQYQDKNNATIIRGIRDTSDFEQEKKVMADAYKDFGVNSFYYLLSKEGYEKVSSTNTRQYAKELKLRELSKIVSPLVVSALIEKIFELRNIFLVVGLPGSGKTTFLKTLAKSGIRNKIILTDDFNKKLQPTIKKHFGDRDLIDVALHYDEELNNLIGDQWLEMLEEEIKRTKPQSSIFIEAAYGLRPSKKIYRFVGGRIIYVGCLNEWANEKRIINRRTPELLPFIKIIPDKQESIKIAIEERLQLAIVNTDGNLSTLEMKVKQFAEKLNQKGEVPWKNYLPGFYSDT